LHVYRLVTLDPMIRSLRTIRETTSSAPEIFAQTHNVENAVKARRRPGDRYKCTYDDSARCTPTGLDDIPPPLGHPGPGAAAAARRQVHQHGTLFGPAGPRRAPHVGLLVVVVVVVGAVVGLVVVVVAAAVVVVTQEHDGASRRRQRRRTTVGGGIHRRLNVLGIAQKRVRGDEERREQDEDERRLEALPQNDHGRDGKVQVEPLLDRQEAVDPDPEQLEFVPDQEGVERPEAVAQSDEEELPQKIMIQSS
jgi:hypothetical protein